MSTFRGTPGPWRYHEGAIVGSEDVHTNGFLRNSIGISSASYSTMVCAIHGHAEAHADPLLPTAPRANAGLIAQAPAMLEVLIRMTTPPTDTRPGAALQYGPSAQDEARAILAALRATGAIE